MITVGVDEAGRGAIVGSVVAAAVILDANNCIKGLKDSKKLTVKKREALYLEIKSNSCAYSFGEANAQEIDKYNILQASLIAMYRAVNKLNYSFDKILVDGNYLPNWPFNGESIIKGDMKVQEISAASILAKVYRDHMMLELDKIHPAYHFAQHKGYPTKLHLEKLQIHGILKCHRKTFSPVKNFLNK